MPTISGSLNLVTDRPVDSISEVWVRARETRGQGDGLVVGVNDRVPVTDGLVEFTALPGAAVLVLVQTGMPIETLPMLVGDEAQQSLRLVVQAGEVAGSADKRVIEQLSAEVAANAARAEQYRTEAAESASAAQASESAASQSASNASGSASAAKQSENNAASSEASAVQAENSARAHKDAAAQSAAAFSIYTGTGSPERKVAAPVGSIYTDTAATSGAIRWIKANGTGKSGWRVEYGDTGWRNVTSLLSNGWTAEQVLLRRQNSTVILSALNLSATNATSGMFISLPGAFHTPKTFVMMVTPTGSRPAFWNLSRGLTVSDYSNFGTSTYASTQTTWQVESDRAWPTTLPGTPA